VLRGKFRAFTAVFDLFMAIDAGSQCIPRQRMTQPLWLTLSICSIYSIKTVFYEFFYLTGNGGADIKLTMRTAKKEDHPERDRCPGGHQTGFPQPYPQRKTTLSQAGGGPTGDRHRHQQGHLDLGDCGGHAAGR
jgi:hypothetical protein